MAKESLAVRYRPRTFEDLTEQTEIVKILTNQINDGTFRRTALFCGPAGCGKTTSARIFARMINGGKGNPIEIDAASNNGVDNVREVITLANQKALDAEYKVFIFDEVHMLSIGAFNALLKLFEEPPLKSVFILCTTDPQKIPATILSRVQRFDFQRISNKGIVNRLKYIVEQEGLQGRIDENALEFIARMASGGMRDSITMLDKCLSLGDKLDVEQVSKILNSTNYDIMFELVNNIIDCQMEKVIDIIEKVYREGVDLNLFIKRLSTLVLDIRKYQLFKSFDYIQVPLSYKVQLDSFLNVDAKFCNYLLDELNKLNHDLKYEQNTKALVEIKLMLLSKEE